jgi:hypothetical protein
MSYKIARQKNELLVFLKEDDYFVVPCLPRSISNWFIFFPTYLEVSRVDYFPTHLKKFVHSKNPSKSLSRETLS